MFFYPGLSENIPHVWCSVTFWKNHPIQEFEVKTYYIFYIFVFDTWGHSFSEICSGRFDTSGSMIPLLVPEISPWVVFVPCTRTRRGEGIGYSSSWMLALYINVQCLYCIIWSVQWPVQRLEAIMICIVTADTLPPCCHKLVLLWTAEWKLLIYF